ncbi:putative 4-hydroxybenzoate polyprenyltransferase [Planctomycetota bacterium]|nr:putative 4-hydroxybenzoate polyprenyltransferase [Planctomycetota bacterium]
MSRVAATLSLVKFSHSVFALPFALMGAWLAAGGPPPLVTLGWIVLCAVTARTAAMAFNRLVDRDIDAANPRTAGRELPSGMLAVGYARGLVIVSAGIFVAGAFALNELAGWLSPAVLGVLLGYSYVKRFSVAVHLVLGVALGLAPLGAWIAVRGDFSGDLIPVLLLFCTVWTWVAGFDLIYACQDAEYDAGRGLHSIPAKLGVGGALRLSRLLHVLTALSLALLAWRADTGLVFWISCAAAVALLCWEQSLVREDDLSRVDVAFFTINGWVGVALFLGLALDMALRSGEAVV